MNRREILRYAAYATGVAVSAPFASAFLTGCKRDAAVVAGEIEYVPTFFSAEEYEFITKVADVIIPRTDTPGASDVGVPEVIDKMIGQVYGAEAGQQAKMGLGALMAKINGDHEGGYVALDDATSLSYLQEMDAKFKDPDTNWMEASEEEQILRETYFSLKQAVIANYFGSEEVATTQLAYDPVPGEYIPCGDLQELTGGKAWAI